MSVHIEVIENTETQKVISILALSGSQSQEIIKEAITCLTNGHHSSSHTIFDCASNPDHKLVIIYK